MNFGKSKVSDSHRLLLSLSDEADLKGSEKYAASSNLSIYYIWKILKNSYKNNKSKISAPRCNDKFELPGGRYSVSDIQDYFEYIFKKTFIRDSQPFNKEIEIQLE